MRSQARRVPPTAAAGFLGVLGQAWLPPRVPRSWPWQDGCRSPEAWKLGLNFNVGDAPDSGILILFFPFLFTQLGYSVHSMGWLLILGWPMDTRGQSTPKCHPEKPPTFPSAPCHQKSHHSQLMIAMPPRWNHGNCPLSAGYLQVPRISLQDTAYMAHTQATSSAKRRADRDNRPSGHGMSQLACSPGRGSPDTLLHGYALPAHLFISKFGDG